MFKHNFINPSSKKKQLMKSSSRFISLFALLSVAALLSSISISASAQVSPVSITPENRNDYFRIVSAGEGVETRYTGLSEAWTQYWDCNPTGETLTAAQKGFSVYFPQGSEYVRNYEIEYLYTEELQRDTITGYEESVHEVCEPENETLEEPCYNLTTRTPIYGKETYEKEYWSTAVPDTKPGECRLARVKADLQIKPLGNGLWGYSVEHVPIIYGESFPEYDLWVEGATRWPVSKPIGNLTTPFIVNDTHGLNDGTGIQFIACANTTASVFNDTDGNWSCADENNEGLPTFYLEGNGTTTDTLDSLIAYYPLDDVYDSSGHGYSCVEVGNPFVSESGQIGRAYDFDGTDDKLTCSVMPELTNIAEITLSFWIYPRNLGRNHFLNLYVQESDQGFVFQGWDDENHFHYVISTAGSSGGDLYFSDGSNTVATNNWYFVVMTWDGSTFNAYVNATLDWTHSLGGTLDTFTPSNPHLSIGGHRNDPEADQNCLFDDFRVYNRSLSQAEVIEMYNNSHPDGYSSLGDMESYQAAPQITLYSPENDKIYNTANINLLWSFIDPTYEEPDWAAYTFNDGIVNESLFFNDENYTKFNFKTYDETYHNTYWNNAPKGITTNGEYFWVTDDAFDEVQRFSMTGEFIDYFNLTNGDSGAPVGITTNGTYLWIMNATDLHVYAYDMEGNPMGFNFSTSENGGQIGITNNGTYFWIVDSEDRYVHRYLMNGTYSGPAFDLNGQMENPWGITQNGTYFWVTDFEEGKIYKYAMDGTYTGRSFSTTEENSVPKGIVQEGNFLWVVNDGLDDGAVYKYAHAPTFSNVTLQAVQGWNNATVCANNTEGDLACNSTAFFVDSIAPVLTIDFPKNNTRYNLTWINITGTANDTNIDTVWINDTNFGTNLGNYTDWNFTNISIEEGSYSLIVYANDTAGNEVSAEVHFTVGLYNVTFHIYDGDTGSNMSYVTFTCSDTDYQNENTGATTNPTYEFVSGNYTCTFSKNNYFNTTQNFYVTDDMIVDVKMAVAGFLSGEEHDWLEYLYNCWSTGDCRDTLNSIETMVVYINQTTEQINETVNKVWDQFEQTDEGVVDETRISMEVNEFSNITINYSITVPVKQGYQFLPIRIFYWFLNEDNTSCYSQGNYTVEMIEPYCQPLVAHTIGEVNTVLNFTVEMRPSLPAGNYTLVRRIDIDPEDVWINYGHEAIGTIEVTEDSTEASVGLKVAGASEPAESDIEPDGLTGEVTGLSFDSGTISLIVSVFALAVILTYVISKRENS